MAKKRTDGSWRYGELPDTAPLAMAYVPLQKSVSPAYESMEALSRGTLFPGLDLPFMGMVNQTQEVTPLTEMMALCFVAHELALYLDTHQDMLGMERYAWLDDPWPWDYDRQREG